MGRQNELMIGLKKCSLVSFVRISVRMGHLMGSFYFPIRSRIKIRHIIGGYWFLVNKACNWKLLIHRQDRTCNERLLFSHQELCQNGTCDGTKA